MKRIIAILFTIITVFVLQSCFTIKYSTKGASIPVEAKTVSVQFFENRAPLAEATLSQVFTDGFKDYIQSNSRLILVNGIGDLDFEGEITGYDSRPTAISANDVAAQNRFTIAVKVRYTNSFDSSKDWEMSFSRFQDFPNTESFESAQASYTEDIIKQIFEDIYNKAFVNW
ncbi:MAG: LptE family protein [Bacteroidales bacterium]|nr:LptE family protein [Bacteroidales bacterium]